MSLLGQHRDARRRGAHEKNERFGERDVEIQASGLLADAGRDHGRAGITNLGVDRAKMHKAFYDASKPGGELVVGDYSAKPGAGTGVAILHRSDETLVRSEIEAAGFKFIEQGDFLRVPADARDAHSHSGAEPVDTFMMKFRKPG